MLIVLFGPEYKESHIWIIIQKKYGSLSEFVIFSGQSSF